MITVPVPVKDFIFLEKIRFYKFQVDSSHGGKGGGLRFIRFNGTRLGLFKSCGVENKRKFLTGTLLQKRIDTKDGDCTVKKQAWPPWSCCTCKDTLDLDYTGGSFWYTVEWKGGIGTWISIPLPRYYLPLT